MQVHYAFDSSTPTGVCACAILGGERSLVTNLGAANNFKVCCKVFFDPIYYVYYLLDIATRANGVQHFLKKLYMR